jgi:hypothetical protein
MFKLKNGLLFLSLFASFAISVLAPPVHAQTSRLRLHCRVWSPIPPERASRTPMSH